MFVCKYCGKECKNANSLRNHERLCKENPNRQISGWEKYNKDIESDTRKVWNKGLTKDTDERVKKQSSVLKDLYKCGKLISHQKGKPHTDAEKQKISESRKKYLQEHPDKIPYKLNHHSKQSYPEQYFENIFVNDETLKNYVKEYHVGLYSLDFAYPNIKFYIEIDGEQHYVDKRIVEHDKVRNNFFDNLGWTSYRIRWSEYQKLNFEDRQNVINEIKQIVNSQCIFR